MKKFLLSVVMAAVTLGACASNPLGNLLGGLGGNSGSDNGSGSALGGVVGGLISGLISTDKVEPASMVGTWKYASPAVCFKSDNFLQKAGGAAVASSIEEQLTPYYKTLKLDRLVLTINEDLTFTMKAGLVTASGTVEKDEDGNIDFHFQALRSVNIGTMRAYVTMTGQNSMSLMFDVSKLITIIKTVGSVTGNSTIKTVTTLLESYDGVCAGFKLTK